MSYYEDRIKALEARIEEMAMLNRMKAIPVEANLMKRIGELNAENARLKAEVERLTKAGDAMKFDCLNYLRELGKRPFGWFPLLSELEVNHKSVQAWNAAKEGKGQP